jgi:hypothetical protein
LPASPDNDNLSIFKIQISQKHTDYFAWKTKAPSAAHSTNSNGLIKARQNFNLLSTASYKTNSDRYPSTESYSPLKQSLHFANFLPTINFSSLPSQNQQLRKFVVTH